MNWQGLQIGRGEHHVNVAPIQSTAEAPGDASGQRGRGIDRSRDFDQQVNISPFRSIIQARSEQADRRIAACLFGDDGADTRNLVLCQAHNDGDKWKTATILG